MVNNPTRLDPGKVSRDQAQRQSTGPLQRIARKG